MGTHAAMLSQCDCSPLQALLENFGSNLNESVAFCSRRLFRLRHQVDAAYACQRAGLRSGAAAITRAAPPEWRWLQYKKMQTIAGMIVSNHAKILTGRVIRKALSGKKTRCLAVSFIYQTGMVYAWQLAQPSTTRRKRPHGNQ